MTDVFSSDQSEEGTSHDDTGVADLLTSITNEEGVQKYKSVEDALKAMPHAQEMIRTLKEENEKYRSELDKRLNMEQVLEELKARKKPDEKPSTEFSPDALMELVDKRLEAKTVEQKAQRNVQAVSEALTKKFGDRAEDVFQSKLKELGLRKEAVQQLASESPQAVLNMFGLVQSKESLPSGKLESSVNTESTIHSGERTYAYYQKMRRENPGMYRQQYMQMLQDAEKMGESFYKR